MATLVADCVCEREADGLGVEVELRDCADEGVAEPDPDGDEVAAWLVEAVCESLWLWEADKDCEDVGAPDALCVCDGLKVTEGDTA